jgi:hypothetical protein
MRLLLVAVFWSISLLSSMLLTVIAKQINAKGTSKIFVRDQVQVTVFEKIATIIT